MSDDKHNPHTLTSLFLPPGSNAGSPVGQDGIPVGSDSPSVPVGDNTHDYQADGDGYCYICNLPANNSRHPIPNKPSTNLAKIKPGVLLTVWIPDNSPDSATHSSDVMAFAITGMAKCLAKYYYDWQIVTASVVSDKDGGK